MIKYIRTEDNIGSKIKDEIVMVNVKQGNYYTLNPVASSIWEILESEHSIDEVCTKLLSEYEIDEESCKAQVKDFINQLLKHKVVKTI